MLRISLVVMATLIVSLGIVDARQIPKEKGLYDPSATKAETMKAWDRFHTQYEKKWKVEWNQTTGTPHLIYGHQIAVPESLQQETIERITRKYLESYREVLQIDLDALVLSKAELMRPKLPGRSTGTWRVFYVQQYRGIPVYGGSVRMIIRNNKLTSLGSDYYPGIDISPDPKITKEKAAQIVAVHMGTKPTPRPLGSKLIVYPQGSSGLVRYFLAWQLTMPSSSAPRIMIEGPRGIPDTTAGRDQLIPVQWKYFVDAVKGIVIARVNLAKYDELRGRVTGTIHRSRPTDPIIQSIPKMTVTLTKDGVPYEATTDESGNYSIVVPSPGSATLEAHLVGPHVRVHNNETPDPDATHAASLSISGTTTHDWDWTSDDPSPNYVETNAFYHVNLAHDWFTRGAPFDIIPDPYPMEVYVRDLWYGARACNASGDETGLSFPIPEAACPDNSLCPDIVYHEYVHTIVYKIYNDRHIFSFPFYSAMHEGWADYFSSSMTNDPWFGGDCYVGRHIDTPDKKFPDDYDTRDAHFAGMILSGAVWDTRAALAALGLGTDYTDGLAILSLKDLKTTFSDYLGAMLENDDDPTYSPGPADNDLANGTPNIGTICHAFYDLHGIYHSYCLGYTTNPVAIITSPDPLSINVFGTSTPIAITGTAARSTSPFQNFVLEWGPGENPDTWSSEGITLTGGGTSQVIDGMLGSLSIIGFADGLYTIRLTVTDAAGAQSFTTTAARVDRLLNSGWPQDLPGDCENAVAVADVDPLIPGLEIVATTHYAVHVYHTDGSSYAPGWPKSGFVLINSAPAVADLDNDGRQEIIVSDWGFLYVWRHDGTPVFRTSHGGLGGIPGIFPSPVVADLDNDGDMEIIAAAPNGSVSIVHHNGTAFSCAGFTWPRTAAESIYSTPAIADIDNDLQKEIVFGCSDGNVYAWKLDGRDVAGRWPVNISQPTLSSPAIGDIDNDANHDLEIVMGASDGRLYAWHHDGSTVAGGWPVLIPSTGSRGIEASPALADLDHNGDLEVIINGAFSTLRALKYDGSDFTTWNPPPLFFFANCPVAGDLNGNDMPEIVVRFLDELHAFYSDGSELAAFPRITAPGASGGAPLITDLNRDGHPEVIAASRRLYVWTLPTAHNTSAQNWPTFHHDMHRTGYYGAGSDLAKMSVRGGSTSIPHGTGVYDFGNFVADGSGLITSPDVTFTIENLGVINLDVSHLVLISGSTSDFVITDITSSPVPPGGTTSFTIRFDPLSLGAKSAVVSISTNDIYRNPYTFRVIGNGVPIDKIFFPPTYSLPWEAGPFIDGIVDRNPDPAGAPELGWNNAYRLTFANGTDPQAAFQCLRSTRGTDPSIYMSFEVKNDPGFDDEDLIILNFRPDKSVSDQPQNDLRIFIFPVWAREGAKDPAAADVAFERNPDNPKPNRPCQDVRFYHRVLQPDGITWRWTQLTDVDRAGFDFKVYSFREGTSWGASYSWNVEVKMPRSITRSGTPWITLQDEFLFYFNIVRVNCHTLPPTAVQYIWPRNLPEQPYDDLEYTYDFPASYWGDASLSSVGQCKGVWMRWNDIGVLNDPCRTTDITSGDITSDINTGRFNASGELISRAINRFVGTVHNSSEKIVDDGTSTTLRPVEARDMKVRFRVAHWGATIGTSDDWRVISGLQPRDVVDPPFPPRPSDCAPSFSFHTTTDADGWLPVQNVPAATGGPPPIPGESHFFYDWILSGDETSGDVQYYRDVQDHQCIYVELSSNSNADIITRSAYRNMNFVEASEYSDVARISTRGCGPPPAGRSAHNVLLQTRMKTWNVPKGAGTPGHGVKTTPNPDVFTGPREPVDSYAEYLVDTYYSTGNFIIVRGRRFDLFSPIGSFGYVAHHDRAVEEWRQEINGAQQKEKGIYALTVPPNSHVNINPFMEAKEPCLYVLSLHGGSSFPLGKLEGLCSQARGGSVDLEYRAFSRLFLSALLGYDLFPAKKASFKDISIMTLSAGIKYIMVFDKVFSGYTRVGPEMMKVEDTGTKLGLMAELGMGIRLNYTFNLELGARYHTTTARDYEFLTANLGLLVKF